jgi:hypothetical protein
MKIAARRDLPIQVIKFLCETAPFSFPSGKAATSLLKLAT